MDVAEHAVGEGVVAVAPGGVAEGTVCWARLYGAVAVEVFGHLDFALTDPRPLFDHTVREVLTALGEPPADRRSAAAP
ncbi:WHG domain-containing protein [Streptoverticillium reticulum]|uniref:WHG domain-containing protein n=1 Tax=Streptoverticillium reticulum TaxID=1433415 RepID=UPI0039BFC077